MRGGTAFPDFPTEAQREIERLKERLSTTYELFDVCEHDIDCLIDRDARFRRRLLRHLDEGRIAETRAMLRWGSNTHPNREDRPCNAELRDIHENLCPGSCP